MTGKMIGKLTLSELRSPLFASLFDVRFLLSSCRLFVRKFITAWYDTLATQISKVDNRDGKEPPTLTYNDDLEEMVQTLCKSEVFLHDPKVCV